MRIFGFGEGKPKEKKEQLVEPAARFVAGPDGALHRVTSDKEAGEVAQEYREAA